MEPEVQKDNGGFKGVPNRKGRTPGSPSATVKDLKNILQLQVLGYTQQQIADRIGRNIMFVNKILKRHEKEIKERLENNIIEEKVRQVRTLDYVVQESARSWEVSKGESPDLEPVPQPTLPRWATGPRPGDVVYLKEMRAALSDQREVFGIGQQAVQNNFNLAQVVDIAEQMDEQFELEQEP